MPDFIRPEVRETLTRWRETLTGSALVALGLWWLFGVGGLLGYLGPFVILAGATLMWIGVQHARFRLDGEAPGTVQVDERQVTYFGPETGGAIALADLERLTLDRSDNTPVWRLQQPGQPHLTIPVNALGAEALFDAFATLPGLKTERMLKELHATPNQAVVIWERAPSRPPGIRLH